MKDSALTRKIAAFVKQKYELHNDEDMLEELGSKGEIDSYLWRIVTDPSDDDLLEIAIDYMRSSLDKREYLELLGTDRLAEKAKRIRKERPLY